MAKLRFVKPGDLPEKKNYVPIGAKYKRRFNILLLTTILETGIIIWLILTHFKA